MDKIDQLSENYAKLIEKWSANTLEIVKLRSELAILSQNFEVLQKRFHHHIITKNDDRKIKLEWLNEP